MMGPRWWLTMFRAVAARNGVRGALRTMAVGAANGLALAVIADLMDARARAACEVSTYDEPEGVDA